MNAKVRNYFGNLKVLGLAGLCLAILILSLGNVSTASASQVALNPGQVPNPGQFGVHSDGSTLDKCLMKPWASAPAPHRFGVHLEFERGHVVEASLIYIELNNNGWGQKWDLVNSSVVTRSQKTVLFKGISNGPNAYAELNTNSSFEKGKPVKSRIVATYKNKNTGEIKKLTCTAIGRNP